MRFARNIIFLIAVTAAFCHAEESGCLKRAIPVSSFNADTSSTPELVAGSLEGFYEKKPVLVKSVQLENTPPRVVLLVDTSGSMDTRVNATIDAAEGVLSSMPDTLQVGLAFFSVDTIPVVLPTTDRKVLIFQLESLRKNHASFRGDTALWSALIQGAKMLETPRTEDAIYLVSDGGENKSAETGKNVLTVLTRAGVRLFAFILTSARSRSHTAEELDGPSEIQKLVVATGGTSIVTTENNLPYSARAIFTDRNGNPTQLGLSVSQQLNQLLRFYRVQITLPESVDKPREWKLRFIGKGKNVILTYPKMLSPCS
jgi:hypothetical protein